MSNDKPPNIDYTFCEGVEREEVLFAKLRKDAEALRDAMLQARVPVDTIKIKFEKKGTSYGLDIHALADNKTIFDARRHVYAFPNEGEPRLYHNSFFIKDSFHQRKGIAKYVLRMSETVADHFDITIIEVGACGSVGGYAWLKYGFFPIEDDIIDIDKAIIAADLTDNEKAEWLDKSYKEKALFVRTDEFSTTYKEAMLSTSWGGVADISDPEVRKALFSRYGIGDMTLSLA